MLCTSDRELQDKNEEGNETLNPLEDPIFYVILIFGAPTVVMLGAAQVAPTRACVERARERQGAGDVGGFNPCSGGRRGGRGRE